MIVFFVTSSDSGSLVIDTITAGGKLDAPVSTGVPFTIVLLLACYAIIKGLSDEPR